MHYTSKDGSKVQPEQWRWVVTYVNGRSHFQFDDSTGTFNSFYSIDQSILRTFSMVNHDTGQEHTLLKPTGAKLIHFYRNTVQDALTENQLKYRTVCYGYEHNGSKVLHAITPKNNILTVDSERFITLNNLLDIDR